MSELPTKEIIKHTWKYDKPEVFRTMLILLIVGIFLFLLVFFLESSKSISFYIQNTDYLYTDVQQFFSLHIWEKVSDFFQGLKVGWIFVLSLGIFMVYRIQDIFSVNNRQIQEEVDKEWSAVDFQISPKYLFFGFNYCFSVFFVYFR